MLQFKPIKKYSLPALVVAIAAALALTACGKKGDPDGELQTDDTLNITSIMNNTSLTPEQRAERMAQAAERLIAPASFMHAYEVADGALLLDPANRKARLIKALFAPMMELKGIFTRIEPLLKTEPVKYADYVKNMADFRRLNPERAVTEFIFDGPQDVQTERDFQKIVALYTLRLDELRLTLKDLKNGPEITLTINDEAFRQKSLADALKACAIRKWGDWSYDTSKCDFSRAYERRMNRADLEAMQQVVAGYQVYFTLMNGYDLTGTYTLDPKTDPQAKFELLLENPTFGTLRSKSGFGVIPTLVQDAVTAVRYASSIQARICAKGFEDPGNRPGYVFSSGLCVRATSELNHAMAMTELMLKGPTTAVLPGAGGHSMNVAVDPFTLFSKPIQDVRTQLPVTTNRCGQITSIGDTTMGGVFPNGEANQLIGGSLAPCYRWK